jgi:hypothetical protein
MYLIPGFIDGLLAFSTVLPVWDVFVAELARHAGVTVVDERFVCVLLGLELGRGENL